MQMKCLLFIYPVESLIAAMAYFFCLDTKETKDQAKGDASTRNAILLARPLCRKGLRFLMV